MPQKCKDLLNLSLEGYTEEEYEALKDIEKKFVKTKRTFKDFKRGLIVPSKLRPKRINGGIILCDTTYEMRQIYEKINTNNKTNNKIHKNKNKDTIHKMDTRTMQKKMQQMPIQK